MGQKSFLYVALVYFLAAAISNAAEPPRPNVVYFLVDDLGMADCGFTGSREIRTPNVDKLAAAGARLDAFYVQPVCSPTRAALMTGRYPMRQGLQVGVIRPWATYGLPLEERTIADDLKAAGYATGIFGKWHLGAFAPEYLPTRRGFARQYGHYNGAIDYFTHERDGGFDWHKDDEVCRDEGYSTTLVGDNAAQFVADNAGKRPFFLYVPFNGVHGPYQPPVGGADAYPDLTGVRRNYAAMMSAVDEAIGKIVQAVEDAGVRENTLFLFSSDNGGPEAGRITDNGKYRGGKGTLYEGGVRVAACAAWDGHIPAGSTVSEPMHAVDVRPTLQKLCGAAPTSDLPMDGVDVWPTLSQGAKSPHEMILLNTTPFDGAIRMGDWKLIVDTGAPKNKNNKRAAAKSSEEVQLFDLRNDPYEKSNLANERPEKVEQLKQALEQFAKEAVAPKGGPAPKSYKAPAVWGDFGG